MRFTLYVMMLLAILPLVMLRPFFGLCVYYVVSLLQPKLLCWHPDFQDAMLVGVPLIVGAVLIGIRRKQFSPRKEVLSGKVVGLTERVVQSSLVEPSWLLLTCALLFVYISVTRLLVPHSLSYTSYQYRGLFKILVVMALITGMASDYRRLRVLYIVVALSVGFWAIKGGLKVITLGPHQVYGKTYDNNLFALTSAMVLPMVFYYGMSLRRAKWRNLLMICSVLICLGIIGSRSRAGFVAFGFVLAGMAWSSRYRVRAVMAVFLVVIVAFAAAGDEIVDRIDSILAYQSDRSARSRFWTWEVARELVARNPVIGVGFANFEVAKGTLDGGQKAAHNIYLQNLAELGFLGHPLWLLVVIGSLVSSFRFMRWSRRLPPDMRWAYYWSRGICLGISAFCIHGLFHNEEYLELMFVIIGLHVALQTATRRELQLRKLQSLLPEKARLDTAQPAPAPQPTHPGRLLGLLPSAIPTAS